MLETFPPFLQEQQLDVTGMDEKVKVFVPEYFALCHVIDVFKKMIMHEKNHAASK